MKVLLLSRYGDLGASSRYRCYQYIPYLSELGINITIAPLLDNGYIHSLYAGNGKSIRNVIWAYLSRIRGLFASGKFDLVWIEKEALPWLPAWIELKLRASKVPYVVDYDDALFHRYDQHSSRVVRWVLGRKIDQVMKYAALVIAGNNYLAERARCAGAARVEWLPTVIDLKRYPPGPKPNSQMFTIGWIGSPVTCRYLKLIEGPLRQICKGGNARVVLIGAGQMDLPGVPVEYVTWSEATEVQMMQSFDIGIMPLPDEPWERGKCGFKLIQYMACWKAVVGSPVGVNQQIIRNGVNGFQAATDEEWVDAFSMLQKDADLRARMGHAGRMLVEDKYCLQVTAPRLVSLLRSVVG